MMSLARVVLSSVLLVLAWTVAATAQDLALPKDSEDSFLRFIHMAQGGALGDDVTNANVNISETGTRVELVRAVGSAKILLLSPKRSQQTTCRYFDIAPGENATASDVARVGRVLDECFLDDPFQFAGLEESLSLSPVPGLTYAWAYGGWRGILRVVERRMMGLASLEYTVGVIVALSLGFVASLALLWGSAPNRWGDILREPHDTP